METSLYELKRAISAYGEVLSTSETNQAPVFWKPFHVCLLTMAMRTRAKEKGFDPSEYHFTDTNNNTIRYLSRMHMWHCLGVKPPVTVNENDPSGRFMPLKQLVDRSKVSDISGHLKTIMKDSGEDSSRSAELMLDELLDNCFAHSETNDDICGLVCAQYWPQSRRAQISILDTGIGIRKSFSNSTDHAELLKTKNSCEYATEYAISSKLGRGHSGYGLTLARGLIQNNGGMFFLASGNEYFLSNGAALNSGELETPFQGTLVVLEWNTTVPLNSTAVYDSWPNIDGDDDDYDF